MNGGEGGEDSGAWCGVRFFVNADVLLTFEAAKFSDLEGQPGKPQQRMALVDGRAVPVTSFPAASLFLKALKGTGNSVVVVSPWRQEKTGSLLRLFGWDTVDDIRTVHPEPGRQQLHLPCVGCAVEEYASAVVVAASRAAWDVSLWPQIVEVRHETHQPARSLALVRALSCCLRIAESRIRFPHTAVAPCVALCRTRLFARCRFFLAPKLLEQPSLAMMINEHGGYMVRRYEDATHCVVDSSTDAVSHTLPRLREPSLDGTESSSSVSSSFSSGTMNTTDEGTAGDGDSKEENRTNLHGCRNGEYNNVDSYSTGGAVGLPLETGGSLRRINLLAHATRSTVGSSLVLPPVNRCHDSGPSDSVSRAIMNQAVTVTTHWLQDCVDGFIMYPPQAAHTSDDSSQWNTSALLLAALLPPSDAKPLSLSHFNCIAEDCGFHPLAQSRMVDGTDLTTMLRIQWGSALCVETTESDLLLSQSPFSPIDVGCELEQHLAFVAEQFCDAWTSVLRDRRLRDTRESGTQTAVVLTATSETNTEATSPFSRSEGTAVAEPPSQGGRALLMRALGPAEWAKEVDASHMAHQASRAADVSLPLERCPTTGVSLLSRPPSAGCDVPTVDVRDGISTNNNTNHDNSSSSSSSNSSRCSSISNGDGSSSNSSTSLGIKTSHKDEKKGIRRHRDRGDVVNPPVADPVRGAEDDADGSYLMCVIPTDALADAQDTLDKDALLRLPPFRNYPMKLTIDKHGIHCLFVTALDAKRFCQEGYAEVCNRFLPIRPERSDESSGVSGRRKRRRSRSPPPKKLSAASSRSSRREAASCSHLSHTHRRLSDTRGMSMEEASVVLSKRDLNLLSEIGATYDFAVQNVGVIERYALNELADPIFHKQRHRLLHIVSKLKQIGGGEGH